MSSSAEELQADSEEDVEDVLGTLGWYARRVEDERGDPRRGVAGDPRAEKTSRYLSEKQYRTMARILGKYSSGHVSLALAPTTRSEVHFYLGLSYERGLFGMLQSRRKAFRHYILSAQLGSPSGTFKVAQCYEKGVGKQKDVWKALYFYRCAAKLGLVDAMHTYGTTVLFGSIGDESDLEIGYFYLRLAARKATSAYPYPLYDLGRCHESGRGPGIEVAVPDDTYAFKLYLKGASLDCPNCQFRVGRCFEERELGQDRDMVRAVEWYAKAADLGHAEAQLRLSELFLRGLEGVVEKNHELAFGLGLKAAARESPVGAYLVSDCYEQGVGVRKSTLLARWWARVADELRTAQGEASTERIKIPASDEDTARGHDFEDGVIAGLIRAQ